MPEDNKEKRVKYKVEEEPSESIQVRTDESEVEKSSNTVKAESKKEENHTTEAKKEVIKSEKTSFFILFLAFITGLVIGAGLIGGIFYYRSKVENVVKVSPSASVYSSPTTESGQITPENSPESSESAVLAKVKINILNGSGKAGEAGKVDTLLKNEGFKETKTGNAGSYNFNKTEIAMKESVSSDIYLSISKALSSYELKKVDNLDDSSNYDVVITVGKSKK